MNLNTTGFLREDFDLWTVINSEIKVTNSENSRRRIARDPTLCGRRNTPTRCRGLRVANSGIQIERSGGITL